MVVRDGSQRIKGKLVQMNAKDGDKGRPYICLEAYGVEFLMKPFSEARTAQKQKGPPFWKGPSEPRFSLSERWGTRTENEFPCMCQSSVALAATSSTVVTPFLRISKAASINFLIPCFVAICRMASSLIDAPASMMICRISLVKYRTS